MLLKLGEPVIIEDRFNVDPLKALCQLLRRLTFPCRHSHLIPRFQQNFRSHLLSHLLSTFDHLWLSSANLKLFADTVYNSTIAGVLLMVH